MSRTSPPVDREFLTDTLRDLVRIDSVNPSLVPGAAGEAEVAAYLERTLRSIGLDVARHEPEPGRASVVGRLAGTGGGRSLMLNGHCDTVGVEGMAEPFSARIRDGRLYGRGAYDMKGSVAACIAAVQAMRSSGAIPAGDVLVAAVADEEVASLGTADLIARYPVDGAIVTEPTSLRVCVAHKGFVWFEVETRGRAAHGSRPELGVDANMHMGRVLARLDTLERAIRQRRTHPLLGPGSLHAATLQGGTGWSTYAARCVLRIERRTIPGETEAQVLEEFQSLLRELAAEDPAFDAVLRAVLTRAPFEARSDSPLVTHLAAAAAGALGHEPDRIGDTPWMDAALLSAAGVDTVVFGPHGGGAHAAEEWVDLDSVERLANILVRTALDYCGGDAA